MIHDGGIARRLRIRNVRIGGRQGDVADGFERDAVVPRVEPDERLPSRQGSVRPGVHVNRLVHRILRRRLERFLNLILWVDVVGARLRVDGELRRLLGSAASVLAGDALHGRGGRGHEQLEEGAAIGLRVDH